MNQWKAGGVTLGNDCFMEGDGGVLSVFGRKYRTE